MSASAYLNAHITRVLNDGGVSPVTIDSAAWLIAVDAWLTSNDLWKYLLYWVNPAFGHKLSSGHVTKIYCLGTTRLPRGGDYTPTTSNTTYSATGMNGTVPGWTNPGAADRGYFGSGRLNNIRRKREITLVAAYKKANSNTATLLATDQFSGFNFQHTSGGNASFQLYDDVTSRTATKSIASHTTAQIIAGTFDGTTVNCYAEAVASSSPQTGLHANTDMTLRTALKGRISVAFASTTEGSLCLVSGSKDSTYTVGTEAFAFGQSEAQFSASDLIVFEKDIGATLIASLTTLLRNRIGA